ncbi:MAG: 2-oxoacid:acceptor oxidoreductase family protein [Thermodesulfobacteriota bacterium]|nr:2-oxoacid:acceptor oxidoreductase family protein [Thermodesulfobacteriota bacterium]
MTKAEKKTVGVAMAGFGGQGVLTIGLLLAEAGLKKFEHVSWIPSYSAAMRGGTVACYITLSDEEIQSPLISRPEVIIVMDPPSLDTYEESILQGGTLIFDSSIIEQEIKRDDIKKIPIPSTALAKDLGSTQVSNLILLGTYLAETKVLPMKAVEETLESTLKESKKEKMIPLNMDALRCGYQKITAC